MIRNLIIVFYLLFYTFSLFGQDTKTENQPVDSKTFSLGLSTASYSPLIGGVIARSSITRFKVGEQAIHTYYAVEAVVLKNERELITATGIGTQYIDFKTNYFFSIRPQYGREKYLFEKKTEQSVGLSTLWAIGPSIGLQKPYLINYDFDGSGTGIYLQYDPEITSDPLRVISAGGLFRNIFQNLKFIPGIHAKAALNLDFSPFSNSVSGMEIGTLIEFFTKKPELVHPETGKNLQTFLNLYLNIYFGTKKKLEKVQKKEI